MRVKLLNGADASPIFFTDKETRLRRGLKGSKAMSDTSAADGRNNLIERAFDLPFGYRATFILRRPDGLEFAGRLTSHASASRARSENFLRPTRLLGASSSKRSPRFSAAEF
jgi:hypothetical protein